MVNEMSICDICSHNNVCSDEGHLDEALTFCADKEERGEILKELWHCRNELCLRCGKYHEAYKGACDDCRFNDEHMKKWEAEK